MRPFELRADGIHLKMIVNVQIEMNGYIPLQYKNVCEEYKYKTRKASTDNRQHSRSQNMR